MSSGGTVSSWMTQPSEGPYATDVPVGPLPLRRTVARAVARAEVEAIQRALEITQGNKSQAARLLRTNYATLHAKMRRHGISTQQPRE
ncbi:MAG TPA: helix-turn-helix domain-containing protein [Candidatus Nitrosotalea sp.]|nr:helix-turn-helix domain-containing protein [Candidatus Nitrosotalea sp.]